VGTIKIDVHPLGGDNLNISLGATRAVVGEVKVKIARAQGTRESKQELFKVATGADGGAVREDDDAEPEALGGDSVVLRDGEVVAMAVRSNFDPLHAKVERALQGHNESVSSMVVHDDDKLISGADDHAINQSVEHRHTGMRAHHDTTEGHAAQVSSMVMHGDKLISGADGHTIKVWNTDTRACVRDASTPSKAMLRRCPPWLVVHGDKLISGFNDCIIKVWNTDTCACENALKYHACCAGVLHGGA
jgi:WD40 repeat protein